jgi:hypothetical protein
MFQGLRTNSPFYILDKGDEMKLKVGQVVSVSNPQPRSNQFGPIPTYGAPQEMFVDVKVKLCEDIMEFKQLNANMNIANSGNLVVSDSKEAMSAEVEGLLRNSRQIVDSVPYHERVITSCDTMLRELNPTFAKEKEQEEKMNMLEGEVTGIKETLGEMMTMLSTALGNSKPKKKEEDL